MEYLRSHLIVIIHAVWPAIQRHGQFSEHVSGLNNRVRFSESSATLILPNSALGWNITATKTTTLGFLGRVRKIISQPSLFFILPHPSHKCPGGFPIQEIFQNASRTANLRLQAHDLKHCTCGCICKRHSHTRSRLPPSESIWENFKMHRIHRDIEKYVALWGPNVMQG